MPAQAILLWSGGKDSALALYEAREAHEVTALITTVTEGYDRVSMHGVRVALLERQARALGLPLEKVTIPPACSNADYEARMLDALRRHRRAGVELAIAGDIFLEDVRRYREALLAAAGMRGVFPLWHREPRELAEQFIGLGFRAVLCCVDSRALAGSFTGREYDRALLADLPEGADVCGENGEFHTFVHAGPSFERPVRYTLGERVLRDERFWYVDLIPEGG
ncbi:MAG TPA: diphthine--ammonia ligase [Gemmataceae bacterium]